MSPWSLPCPKSVVMQVTFLLLFFFNTEYCITLPPELRRSTEGKVRLCAVVSTTGLSALVCCAESDCAQWFAVWSPTVRNSLHWGFWLNAVVYSAESDSTQWFTVQSPNSTQWFAVWSPTVRNSLHFAVRSPNMRSGLQCRVRLYTVVCSVESDSTQWFFLPCWVWLCAVDYNVETQRSGLQCGVQLLALLSRGPNDTFYYL